MNISDFRLWQLISPSLPIGAYAYSQGLESAVEKEYVTDEAQACEWISGLLTYSLANLDAPIFYRMYQAWSVNNELTHSEVDNDEQNNTLITLQYWNQFLLASRESSELLAEDRQMAKALLKLFRDLSHTPTWQLTTLEQIEAPSFLLVFSMAAQTWGISAKDALRGFLWSWCENQVAAAIKLVPLGQTAGQRILSRLMPEINQVEMQVLIIKDDQIGSVAQGFSILSAQHETQYSRLFRS
jgi:urease accessory protein